MVGRLITMSPSNDDAVRILVVDDDDNIRYLLTTAVRHAGFSVAEAATGRAALEQVAAWNPDLVLLDVMLPDLDGFDVCKRLRADRYDVPVIFLTARDGVDDRIRGLTLGGDDYVTKPFSLEEVVTRVRTILRRIGRGSDDAGDRLSFADVDLEEEAHRVTRSGRVLDLSPTEFKLLRYFLLNPDRVLSRAQLVDRVWDYDFDGDTNVVETYVSYLRKKLEDPPLIQTVRGVGYVLRQG